MFEISELKNKKLPELQEIAKELDVPKYRTQKKLDLVYQILDYQAANPKAVKAVLKSEESSSVTTKTETATSTSKDYAGKRPKVPSRKERQPKQKATTTKAASQ